MNKKEFRRERWKYGWVITRPKYGTTKPAILPYWWSADYYRHMAIKKFIVNYQRNWKYYYRRGFRCVKCTLLEEDKDE